MNLVVTGYIALLTAAGAIASELLAHRFGRVWGFFGFIAAVMTLSAVCRSCLIGLESHRASCDQDSRSGSRSRSFRAFAFHAGVSASAASMGYLGAWIGLQLAGGEPTMAGIIGLGLGFLISMLVVGFGIAAARNRRSRSPTI